MSINAASTSLAYLIGSALGGYILLNINWSLLGPSLGIFRIISTIIYEYSLTIRVPN